MKGLTDVPGRIRELASVIVNRWKRGGQICEIPFQQRMLEAAFVYPIRPYAGRIAAISPVDHPAFMDLRESWRNAPVSNLEVFDIPGDHNSFLDEEHVAAVAACLKQTMAARF